MPLRDMTCVCPQLLPVSCLSSTTRLAALPHTCSRQDAQSHQLPTTGLTLGSQMKGYRTLRNPEPRWMCLLFKLFLSGILSQPQNPDPCAVCPQDPSQPCLGLTMPADLESDTWSPASWAQEPGQLCRLNNQGRGRAETL